ncbi:MAG: hypothetical protein QOG61_2545, partial [Candidatus Binataceae bacterium]|nr:hypothetical protein [Candidatus Binataceae bacterium]
MAPAVAGTKTGHISSNIGTRSRLSDSL